MDRLPIDSRPGEVRGCAGWFHSRLSPSLIKTDLQALLRRSTCWTWALFRAGQVRPVSGSLQTGLGFFQHPIPHLRRRPLRSACLDAMAAVPERLWPPKRGEKIGPCSGRNDPGRRGRERPPLGRKDRAYPSIRRRYEVSTFRSRSPRGGRCLLSTGCRFRPRGVAVLGPFRTPVPLDSSLSASLACSRMTIGHRRFTSVHLARSLALTRIEASRKARLSRDFEPRAISTLRHIVRVALYSDP